MVGKVEIKPGQTLAAQFREKGAVELGGLILVEIGRGNAGRALSFVYLSIALENRCERPLEKGTTLSKPIESSLFEKKRIGRWGRAERGRGEENRRKSKDWRGGGGDK